MKNQILQKALRNYFDEKTSQENSDLCEDIILETYKLGIDITEMINDFRTTFNFEPKKIERYKDFMIPINELEHKK